MAQHSSINNQLVSFAVWKFPVSSGNIGRWCRVLYVVNTLHVCCSKYVIRLSHMYADNFDHKRSGFSRKDKSRQPSEQPWEDIEHRDTSNCKEHFLKTIDDVYHHIDKTKSKTLHIRSFIPEAGVHKCTHNVECGDKTMGGDCLLWKYLVFLKILVV
jgi:hypothetical protein